MSEITGNDWKHCSSRLWCLNWTDHLRLSVNGKIWRTVNVMGFCCWVSSGWRHSSRSPRFWFSLMNFKKYHHSMRPIWLPWKLVVFTLINNPKSSCSRSDSFHAPPLITLHTITNANAKRDNYAINWDWFRPDPYAAEYLSHRWISTGPESSTVIHFHSSHHQCWWSIWKCEISEAECAMGKKTLIKFD